MLNAVSTGIDLWMTKIVASRDVYSRYQKEESPNIDGTCLGFCDSLESARWCGCCRNAREYDSDYVDGDDVTDMLLRSEYGDHFMEVRPRKRADAVMSLQNTML